MWQWQWQWHCLTPWRRFSIFIGCLILGPLKAQTQAGSCWTTSIDFERCCRRNPNDSQDHNNDDLEADAPARKDDAGCWQHGRSFESCCNIQDWQTRDPDLANMGLYMTLGATFTVVLGTYVSQEVKRNTERLRKLDAARSERVALKQQAYVDAAAVVTATAEAAVAAAAAAANAAANDLRRLPKDVAQESALLAAGDDVMLVEVLSFLDGESLCRWECTAKGARLCVPSWSGMWRLAHVLSLGGKAPTALARHIREDLHYGACERGFAGPWKEWWFWARQLRSQSEQNRFRQGVSAMAQMVRIRRVPLPTTSAAAGAAAATAAAAADSEEFLPTSSRTTSMAAMGEEVVPRGVELEADYQVMQPEAGWLEDTKQHLKSQGFLDCWKRQDPRFAPFDARWRCHLLVAAAPVLLLDGATINHFRAFATWSFCFGAANGRPRFFMAIARHFMAQDDAWEVEILHGPLAGRRDCSWEAVAAEAAKALTAGLDPTTLLSGLTRFVQLKLSGSDFTVLHADWCPQDEIAAVTKELFGSRLTDNPSKTRTEAEARRTSLAWVTTACCPQPFLEYPRAAESLAGELSRREALDNTVQSAT